MTDDLGIDFENEMHRRSYQGLLNYAAGQRMFDQKGRLLSGKKAVMMEFGDNAPEELRGHTHVMHRETFAEMGGMDRAREVLPGATIIHGGPLFDRRSKKPWMETT